jgi:hypothetical protein
MKMKNVEAKIEGGKLIITCDLNQEFGPSKSTGKTITVATSEGNVPVPGAVTAKGKQLSLGLNLYFKP